jgi:hypothetical protein
LIWGTKATGWLLILRKVMLSFQLPLAICAFGDVSSITRTDGCIGGSPLAHTCMQHDCSLGLWPECKTDR